MLDERERLYKGKAAIMNDLASYLVNNYKQKNYETQIVPASSEEVIVQIKKEDTVKALLGMTEVLSISIKKQQNDLSIAVGKSRWIDKIGAGAVGAIVFWPLIVTAGIGAYKQYSFMEEIWEIITGYIGETGFQSNQLIEECANTGNVICSTCQAAVSKLSKFCTSCGAPMNTSSLCKSCAGTVEFGMKFCPHCGAKLTD